MHYILKDKIITFTRELKVSITNVRISVHNLLNFINYEVMDM